jgi:hypothetical protein
VKSIYKKHDTLIMNIIIDGGNARYLGELPEF